MQLSTTIRSPGALALGLFFAGVTARTIFDDVFAGAPVTIAHLNALAALVAAIAAGHFVVPTFAQGRFPAALGLALIFVGATAYVVTSSGARNAEVANHKAAAVVKTNEERAVLKGKLADAEADVETAKGELEAGKAEAAADVRKAASEYDAAKRAAATECATGKKSRCEGREATRDAAKADLEAAEARAQAKRTTLEKAVEKAESHAGLMRGRIAMLGPEARSFEGYRHAALVFEAANMGDAGVIEARLELLMPFASVLIAEVSTLVFLGMALGQRGGSQQTNSKQATNEQQSNDLARGDDGQSDFLAVPDVEAAEIRGFFNPDSPNNPAGGARNHRQKPSGGGLSKADALDDLMQRLADGRMIPSQEVLASDWGRPKQTVSDWMREWRRIGVIPQPVQTGRCKAIMGA
jgi:hypothetical protein